MAANPDRSSPVAAYAPKWDNDPMVLCSRRPRVVSFPTVVLLREPTDADRAAMDAPPHLERPRDETAMTILAGVNFLGALTTAWAPEMFRAGSHAAAPRSVPPLDRCVLVAPTCRTVDLSKRVGFVDRDTGRMRAEAVEAAWLRVLAWMRAREDAQVRDLGQANVPLFGVEQGFEAPEFVECRLSELLTQKTEKGAHAYQHALGAIPYAKDGMHLGALHDYAVRSPNGWPLATACRTRATAAPALMRNAT